jgi:hypothetical protein
MRFIVGFLPALVADQGPNQTAKKGAPKAKAPANVRTLKQTPTKPKLTPSKGESLCFLMLFSSFLHTALLLQIALL